MTRTDERSAETANASSGMTLAQLAVAAGMTPRNVRAHRSRGLVHAPTVRGRTGYYDGTHLSRLLLVRALQERGLNLAAISALVSSRETVRWLFHDMRRQARADGEGTITLPPVSVARLREVSADAPDQLCQLGFLQRGADGGYVADAVVFTAATALIERGVPTAEIVRVLVQISTQARQVAAGLTDTLRLLAASSDNRSSGSGGPSDAPEDGVAYAVQLAASGFELVLTAALDGAAPSRPEQLS